MRAWRKFSRRAVASVLTAWGSDCANGAVMVHWLTTQIPARAPLIGLGDIETHRLVSEVVDRRSASLGAGRFLGPLGGDWVQRIRVCGCAPEVDDATDGRIGGIAAVAGLIGIEQELVPAQLVSEEALDDLHSARVDV